VPPSLLGVVTVTLTTPAFTPGGAMAINVLADVTVTFVAGKLPNETLASGLKEVPVTVTSVPPNRGPDPGLRPVTRGGP
jgi:hypothetical protein